MGRRDLSDIKPLVLKHNRILRDYGFSLRSRQELINNFDLAEIRSLSTLHSWDKEEQINRTRPSEESDSDLGWKCEKCKAGDLKFDLQNGLICNSCKVVIALNLSNIKEGEKQSILRHNRILKRFDIPIETRVKWINGYNHVSVSLKTLRTWDKEDEQRNRTPPILESNNGNQLGWKCDECKTGDIYPDNDAGELVCLSCGVVAETIPNFETDIGTQIKQNQPALQSSFNHGLGTPTTDKILNHIVGQVRDKPQRKSSMRSRSKTKRRSRSRKLKKTEQYKKIGDVLKLRKFVSGRDSDSKINALLSHLSDRLKQMQGFDPTSDNDRQFGEIDRMGLFLRKTRKLLRGQKFNSRKLVDALLFILYGEKARAVVEQPNKHLACPRCRSYRNYANDSDPQFILCLKCGKQVRKDDAIFKVTVTHIEPVYLKTVQRILILYPEFAQIMKSNAATAKIEQPPVIPDSRLLEAIV